MKVVNESLYESKNIKAQLDIHLRDVMHNPARPDFTIEFNVKNPDLGDLQPDIIEYEMETGRFTLNYAKQAFDRIKSIPTLPGYTILGLDFAGRSNGWYVLLYRGEKERLSEVYIEKLEDIISLYFKNYQKEFKRFYNI